MTKGVTPTLQGYFVADTKKTVGDLFRFNQTGLDENGKVLGRLEKTVKIPTFVSAFKANGIDIDKQWFLDGAMKMDDADVAFGH